MKYYDTNTDQMGTGDNYKGQYNFEEIKKSFYNDANGLMYFLEDTGYRDAMLLEINFKDSKVAKCPMPVNDAIINNFLIILLQKLLSRGL